MKALYLLIMLVGLMPTPLFAGGNHDEPAAESEVGPHHGQLFVKDDFTLELTIFEDGLPPEMRLYAYQNDEPISPEMVSANVTISRLGSEPQIVNFQSEQDYLLGDLIISEPHSFSLAITAQFEGNTYQWQVDSFEGRAVLTPRIIKASGIQTELAGPQTIHVSNALFGVVAVAEDRLFNIHAPYPGIVEAVHVKTGDKVAKGQKLLTVRNQQTLQTYAVTSPANGEVTNRLVKAGDHSSMGSLLQISDLSKVWVDLSMFPQDIEQLKTGMPVTVSDLHGHDSAEGKIEYISPKMTGGHIARARTVIDNTDGLWRPGMHINALVSVEKTEVPLAVKRSALQTFRDMDVVFARYGDTFEVRMVKLGRKDQDYVEVLGGLELGTEYVTDNSYLLKAEVLKDGASHSH